VKDRFQFYVQSRFEERGRSIPMGQSRKKLHDSASMRSSRWGSEKKKTSLFDSILCHTWGGKEKEEKEENTKKHDLNGVEE